MVIKFVERLDIECRCNAINIKHGSLLPWTTKTSIENPGR